MSSIKKFNTANTQAVKKIGINNLDIYIPRIDEKHSEHDVKILFANFSIGLVDFVDFVSTKDPATKEIKYYSAFLKLTEWNPDGYWFNKIIVEKQNKIQISPFEFWVLLPAKTMISRSKVNTHQLVAYTDELYVRVEEIEKSVTETMTISSEHFKTLLNKTEAQAAQIDKLMKIVQIQAEKLEQINAILFEKKDEEISSRPRALTIEDLNQDQYQYQDQDQYQYQDQDQDQIICDKCSMEFDTEKQLCFHNSVCKKEPLKPDDDDCFLSKHPIYFRNHTKTFDSKSGIIRGSFSVDLEDVLGPLAKSLGLTKEQAEKELEKEIANSQRAVSSRNYCGNE
jgi:NACalpha-BTF3-like transcription factor